MDVDQLVADMAGTGGFIASRAGIADENTTQVVLASLATSMSNKILQLGSLDHDQANVLQTALQTSSYTQHGKEEIIHAIDSRLMMAEPHRGTAKPKVQCQVLIFPCSYLTAADWDGLLSPRKEVKQKTQIIIDRFLKLGLTNPHEQTYKWALAILAIVGFEIFPKYNAIFIHLQDMKELMDSAAMTAPRWPFTSITHYPRSPHDLPSQVFKHAYADSDPPITQHLERLQQVALHHIPLRKNSKLLVNEARHDGCTASRGRDALRTDDERGLMSMLRRALQNEVQPRIEYFDDHRRSPPPPRGESSYRRGRSNESGRRGASDSPPDTIHGEHDADDSPRYSHGRCGSSRRAPLALRDGHGDAVTANAGDPDHTPRGAARMPPQPSGRGIIAEVGGFVAPRPLPTLPSSLSAPPSAMATHSHAIEASDLRSGAVRADPADGPPTGVAFADGFKEDAAYAHSAIGAASLLTDDGGQIQPTRTRIIGKTSASTYETAGLAALSKRDMKRKAQSKDKQAAETAVSRIAAEAAATYLKTLNERIAGPAATGVATGAAPAAARKGGKGRGKDKPGHALAALAASLAKAKPGPKTELAQKAKLEVKSDVDAPRGTKHDRAGEPLPSKKGSKPSFAVEWSRSQVLCRTGIKGEPSIALKFEEHGGIETAVAAAKLWVSKVAAERVKHE